VAEFRLPHGWHGILSSPYVVRSHHAKIAKQTALLKASATGKLEKNEQLHYVIIPNLYVYDTCTIGPHGGGLNSTCFPWAACQ